MKKHFMNTVSTLALSIVLLSASANARIIDQRAEGNAFQTRIARIVNERFSEAQARLKAEEAQARQPFDEQVASLETERNAIKSRFGALCVALRDEETKLNEEYDAAKKASDQKLAEALRPLHAEQENIRSSEAFQTEMRPALENQQSVRDSWMRSKAQYIRSTGPSLWDGIDSMDAGRREWDAQEGINEIVAKHLGTINAQIAQRTKEIQKPLQETLWAHYNAKMTRESQIRDELRKLHAQERDAEDNIQARITAIYREMVLKLDPLTQQRIVLNQQVAAFTDTEAEERLFAELAAEAGGPAPADAAGPAQE